ncbi:MAG: hypothetical protein D6768_20355 [Chloroflexi bacterium]|nr:MAG: hypothetical protein D6768_20355 [Chloroflexota bacterium]
MTQETSDGVPVSDGFDYPVGPRGANVDVFKTHKIDTVLVDPDYHQSLGYWHPGEDWNGRGGGDTDLGDPIYTVSNGKVVEFGHYSVWGNIVLLEHALPDGTRVWSQYAHLQNILVEQVGQKVSRGQQIGTMGKGDNNRFIAHLHFEIRKKRLPINNWSPTVKDKNAVLENYYSPKDFIANHRPGMLDVPAPEPSPEVAPTQIMQLVLGPQAANPQAGGFFTSETANWNTAEGGYAGTMLWANTSAQNQTHWAEWRPAIPAEGVWEVWAFIPKNKAGTSYARYQVIHAGGQTEVPVNQQGNPGKWEILGQFRFAPGKGYVRLTNVTGELPPTTVAFDSVCWTKVGG